MTDDRPLQTLLTDVIGSGPKTAEDMTREQAATAMTEILTGDPDRTTLGAFWLANRWKTNTPEELAASLDVLSEHVTYETPDADPVDCGANYDGKAATAILGVAAGAVAAAAGTPVVVHSGDRVPTQQGDAYKHVLDELGVRTDLSPAESADMVDDIGVGFYYQPAFNPAVDDLFDRREAMGVRTFLNTIETLVNPAGASVHLGSFYHLSFAKRVIGTIEESQFHDHDRVVMVQGLEGYDDVRPGLTKIADWTPERGIEADEIETAAFGMDIETEDLNVEDVAADSARLTREVLTGDRTDHWRDAVALNAALRIYAGGDVGTIEAAFDDARAAIADGSAAAVLDDLRGF